MNKKGSDVCITHRKWVSLQSLNNKDKYDIEQAIKQGLKDGKISQQKCDYLLDKLLKS